MPDPTYSVVVPCYRSGRWLGELVTQIRAALEQLGEPYEILLLNDASPDDTWQHIARLAEEVPGVRGIDLVFNTGQFRTTLCGLEQARGRYVITLDDDGQHPPSEIPKLIRSLQQRPELDCVMASFPRKRHGRLRNLGTRLSARLSEIIYGKPPGLQSTAFRILRQDVAQVLCQHGTVNPNVNMLLFRTTKRIVNAAVEHRSRAQGQSGYSLGRLMRMLMDNVFSASTLPLKGVSLLGLASAGLGLLLGTYYLVAWLTGVIAVPGFATLVLLIIFFGGMTMFSVGLVGEYLIRIMEEVRRPPRYVIRQQLGGIDLRPGAANGDRAAA